MLPLGMHTFRGVRESGGFYVDKTGFAARMISRGKYYSLLRPRCFGKSVFTDMLKELFEGNEELFQGLTIHDGWDWSVRYPVVRFSFGSGCFTELGALQADVLAQLERLESEAGVHEAGLRCEAVALSGRFHRLLAELHRRRGRRVVVLVDDYDKPILDVIEDPDTARKNCDFLLGFYSTIKSSDEHVQFVFLTGTSKCYNMSIFSGLNNLYDITLTQAYSAVCGFTEAELDSVFAAELEGLDRDTMRKWYNGYSWLGEEKVYNPYDVLKLLYHREFDNYWFKTGSPRFLIDMLMERGISIPQLSGIIASRRMLTDFDVDYIGTEALLFQSGYLTIVGKEDDGWGLPFYRLDYPNLEVRQSLDNLLPKHPTV